MEVKIQTLTPLWTGDVNRQCSKIKETGIIGSLRWWYEALVRGLGGYACDPTSNEKNYKRCELKPDKFYKALMEGKSIQDALDEQICPACQLFGCSGWRKKLGIRVENIDKNEFIIGKGERAGLKSNEEFSIEIIENRVLRNEEKWLFKKLLWLIENFGAIGGRTVWKPAERWGTPYGIIKIVSYNGIENWDDFATAKMVKSWLTKNKGELNRINHKDWFNFKFYWMVKDHHLNREQINKIVKRKRGQPTEYDENASEFDRWLGGRIGVSKKIFSFYNRENKVSRVFGYVRDEEEMKKIEHKLREILGKNITFMKGSQILEGLE